MAHGKRIMGRLYVIVSIIFIVSGVLFFIMRDKEGPVVTISPDSPSVSSRPLTIDLKDEGSGLRSLEVFLIQGEKELPAVTRHYPDRPRRISETFTMDESKLTEGSFTLRVIAKDGAFLGGVSTQIDRPFVFDKTPPTISVLSRAHYLRQGGSGLVSFSLSEKPARTGIKVGDRFFPAYLQPSGNYLCLFTFPFDTEKKDFQPMILAEDPAGNISEAGFYHSARAVRFRSDRINISDQFLNAKMPQFRSDFPDAQTPLEIFLKVNKELRAKNRKILFKYGKKSSNSFLFDGAFVRQPGKTMATFGDQRSYFYKGKQIDNQTHLGVDIASFVQSPIKASNSGQVIFAGFYGIYGECVIIDHGLGLQSLYGHLSRIDVAPGQEVAKETIIGLSGATGMAGGDHLHFGILISGVPVDPVEWWDANWVKNNIHDKF